MTTNLEQKVEGLLRELADAVPVEVPHRRPVPSAGDGPGGVYPVRREIANGRSGRRLLVLTVAAIFVLAAGLLVVSRGGDSPVVVSEPAALPVDTTALGATRMAVVVENDLFVADGPSGRVWRLTRTGRGEEVSNVSFSHDGEWVAFTIHDESGLWVSRWDGTERHRLGRAPRSYAWSPVSSKLAYATQQEVRVADVDGSSRALEGGPRPVPFTPVVWSPDGTSLSFTQSTGPGPLGGTARAVLAGNDEAGWGPFFTTPAASVLAWPRPDLLLVDQLGRSSDPFTLAVLSWVDGSVRELADVALGATGHHLSVGSARLVGVAGSPNQVTTCTLSDLACGPVPVPFAPQGYSEPVLSPDEEAVALVAGVDGTHLGLFHLMVADLSGTERVHDLGPVDRGGRGTVVLEGKGYGVVPEAPQWLDDRTLVARVDEREVVRIDVESGRRTSIVSGDRFLPPVDDYPGGSGLAVWRPTS